MGNVICAFWSVAVEAAEAGVCFIKWVLDICKRTQKRDTEIKLN